ncbi:MAG: hypothetical protein FWH10_01515 [Oscillospiraceae bacterium]|nr:hypothetical protein [Oscillospiraceae bacterium]
MIINTPEITDIDTVISIYYRYPEIGTKQIEQIFSKRSKATVSRLKKSAKKQMAEDNIYTYGMYKINTECAYKVWGIDVLDLERRRNKLQKLGL